MDESKPYRSAQAGSSDSDQGSRAELSDRRRFETRYYISSPPLTAAKAGEAVRGHWGIENRLHWVLDVVFGDDQSRLRKGHGAKTIEVVRHFIRSAKDKRSIKLRRKIAAWDANYLATLPGATSR
jgi:predicted transposase YbfD/YdcC